MRENDWTKSICDILKKQDFSEEISIDVLQKIPYAFEISSFTENWKLHNQSFNTTSFETDMVIYEKKQEK